LTPVIPPVQVTQQEARVPTVISCCVHVTIDTGLQQDSKAQAEQIRSVAIQRIGDQVGRVPPALMSQLDEALRLHLELLRACHRRYGDMARPMFVVTGLRVPSITSSCCSSHS
jgi:hypothetical protein